MAELQPENASIAVLIPCYQEELTIGKVIQDFKRALPKARVYVFDNNCTDATARIAREPASPENIRTTGHPRFDLYKVPYRGLYDADVRALRAYSDLIAEVVRAALSARDHSVLADQLRYALDYRVVIERAVGYLMGSRGLDAVTAFNGLRKRARDSQRWVADVAAELLAAAGNGTGAGKQDRS